MQRSCGRREYGAHNGLKEGQLTRGCRSEMQTPKTFWLVHPTPPVGHHSVIGLISVH